MVIFYKKWKKYNEIQLTKKKWTKIFEKWQIIHPPPCMWMCHETKFKSGYWSGRRYINENGVRLREMCKEQESVLGNAFSRKKNIKNLWRKSAWQGINGLFVDIKKCDGFVTATQYKPKQMWTAGWHIARIFMIYVAALFHVADAQSYLRSPLQATVNYTMTGGLREEEYLCRWYRI